MSALIEAQVKRHRRDLALKAFETPLLSASKLPNDDHLGKFYEFAGQTIGRDTPIRYLEFGVFDGTSMSKMLGIFPDSYSEFVGFDSFEGLPEQWGDFARGKFSTAGALPYTKDRRVQFVKGWFQNTLPGYLAELNARQNRNSLQTLIHYDADLYSSTLFILGCLWLHIPEYYFIFDEFSVDEVIALQDFASAFPVKLEFLGKTSGPMQVFGKLTRTELTLG